MKPWSIRRRLTSYLLLSVVLVWSVMLVLGYLQARHESDERSDERLMQIAQTVLLLAAHEGPAHAGNPGQSRAGFTASRSEHHKKDEAVQLRLWDRDGRVVFSTQGWPETQSPGAWHAYQAQDQESGFRVQVLESERERNRLARKMASRILPGMLLALAILAALAWLAIDRSLMPLVSLAGVIARRSPEKLQPLAIDAVPQEVRPVVESLNTLLQRLALALERERSFTADAAHELRTPLSAIRVQSEVALSATSSEQRQAALEKLVAGVERATRLVEQLLALARLEQANQAEAGTTQVDEAIVETLAAVAGQAEAAGISLSADAQSHSAVRVDQTAFSILLQNLVDNALKYAGPGAHIVVSARTQDAEVHIEVQDDGPGVAAETVPMLTRRFFRPAGSRAYGSGLGLAIVARIVEAYGGKLSFGPGLEGKGLGVALAFAKG